MCLKLTTAPLLSEQHCGAVCIEYGTLWGDFALWDDSDEGL